jgi:hypothetical protein
MAFVDTYSIQHLISGFLLGAYVSNRTFASASLFVTVLSIAWELLELYGHSRGWSWPVQAWWEYESWSNRWVFDIGANLSGAILGYYLMQLGKSPDQVSFSHELLSARHGVRPSSAR